MARGEVEHPLPAHNRVSPRNSLVCEPRLMVGGFTGNSGSLAGYFCQVRFLWRLARDFFLRLCLLIFAFRRFFSEPMYVLFPLFLSQLNKLMDNLVERILNDALCPGGLERRDDFPGDNLLDDGLDRHPAAAAQAGDGWLTQGGQLFQHL